MKMTFLAKSKGELHYGVTLLLIIAVSLAITLLLTRNQGWQTDALQAIEAGQNPAAPIQGRAGPRQVRPAGGAGGFYPAGPAELYRTVAEMLDAAPALGLGKTRAVLVPHAGYIYSGAVAAAAFREVDNNFRRVFILAANHNGRADFAGVSLPNATHYAIPGAEIPVDALTDELLQESLFTQVPAAHTMYMAEVELPFLYARRGRPAVPDFTVIPMILGRLDDQAIKKLAQVLSRYAADDSLFVFSVDLSHFFTYDQAKRLDSYTVQAILNQDKKALAQATTDGNQVLLAMLELAGLHNWEASHLLSRNSGDATGDRQRVVGYAAIAFQQPFRLAPATKQALLAYARKTIAAYLEKGKAPEPDREFLEKHPVLQTRRGVFVTLKKHGQLRGCIGEIMPKNQLYKGIQQCAVNSAIRDPRFKPVTRPELDSLSVSISILDLPRPVLVDDPRNFPQALRPGQDGIILTYKGRQSTYLPQVWGQIPDPVMFLGQLCLKQGSPSDCWQSAEAVLYRYGAYEFGETSTGN